MAKIEGFGVRNFRTLRDVTLGKLWNTQSAQALTPMTAVIGKNGVGKSTLFDAFGFLADCLKMGVGEACDIRGGFERIRSQGQTGPIQIKMAYREDGSTWPTYYNLHIDFDESRHLHVKEEALWENKKVRKSPPIELFLHLENGRGVISTSVRKKEPLELADSRKLGIAALGAFKQHPRIATFRQFIEDWYLSYFTPDAARSLPLAGPQKHLNIHGDNIGNVVQFMEREHKDRFQRILNRIAGKIPGIDKIDTVKTQDGRLLLRFNDKGFHDPFYAQQMSDGTLKVFAYLLLLEDPTPPPFICIEEPENGLYHKLLETLAREFREHATGKKGGSQIFVTTHQPYFVDALEPEEVWVLEKGADGFATLRRASDDTLAKEMVAQGLPLGGLWYSDYLDAR